MNKILLIAEGGVNANGHLDWALELCDQAKEANCDVIKWQKRTPELSVPEHMKNQPRIWENETITYLEYRRKVEFGNKEYDAIATHCKSIGIQFSASVWDEPSVEFMAQYDIPWVKIPSAKLTDHSLIKKAQSLGLPLIVSTGMSTEKEVDEAVPHIRRLPGATLMHCNSSYPSSDEEQNLSYIPVMRDRYNFPIGYSSHSVSPWPAITAVAVGATCVEAHLSLDRSLEGSDQAASLELKGMVLLRREIDRVSVVLGSPEKIVWDSEKPARLKLRGY
jgi:N-acetylneuraminate synthase